MTRVFGGSTQNPKASDALKESDGLDELVERHREENAQSKGAEKSVIRHLDGGGYVSAVFVTTGGAFIMRTVWGEHGGLSTEVMLPEECPYEDLVRLARQREKAVGD